MRLWLISLAAFLCAFTGNTGANPNELTWWWYAGDPTVLRPAIECALSRIRAATCLPVDVSLDAHQWVRQTTPADLPSGSAAFTSGPWSATRTKVSIAVTAAQMCPVLIHEMVHALRHDWGHSGPDGSFSFPVTHIASQPVSKLTTFDIGAICAVQQCNCSNPEP